jgi:uncharacterized protein YndB with AHSA1/START domain
MPNVTGTRREFTIHRHLEATPERVFRAWTEPEQLRWFAGTEPIPGYPTTVDLRVGGAWRVYLVQPDGPRYYTGGVYTEVVEGRRLTFHWGAVDGFPAIDLDNLGATPLVTVTLVEARGGTDMAMHVGFVDGVPDERVKWFVDLGFESGMNDTIDRLAPYLGAARGG